MVLSIITKQHIEKKLGQHLRYPSDYEYLACDIEKVTKRRLSINTLKRLFGLIKCVNAPRLYTLDTIAAYLEYENWDAYQFSLPKEVFVNTIKEYRNNPIIELHSDHLSHGQKVVFQYYPDRIVEVEYLGKKQYRVAQSSNSMLKVDDIVEVQGFHVGYPLLIPCLVRKGISLGRFLAGEISGLTSLELK